MNALESIACHDEPVANPSKEELAMMAKGFVHYRRRDGKEGWYKPTSEKPVLSDSKARSSAKAKIVVPCGTNAAPLVGRKKSTGLEDSLAVWLQSRKSRHEILNFKMQPDPLPLGHRCGYTPDAEVALFDGSLEYYEAKGGYTDKQGKRHSHFERFGDGLIKIKWAADKYPMMTFYVFEIINGQIWLTHVPAGGVKPQPKRNITQ